MHGIASRWAWRMAWRDSRGSRRRLLLYVSSIVAGVAALVAIGSFQANLNAAIEDRAKTLLGADLRIDSQRAFSAEAEELLRSLSPLQSRQVEFASMAYFPGPDTSRLVSVRALEGGFPYYGELETDPIEAAAAFRSGGHGQDRAASGRAAARSRGRAVRGLGRYAFREHSSHQEITRWSRHPPP